MGGALQSRRRVWPEGSFLATASAKAEDLRTRRRRPAGDPAARTTSSNSRADPDGRPVVHHRTVDTLGIMLRAGTITREMHDAARDFQAQFTISQFDVIRCMPLMRLPSGSGPVISPRAGRRPPPCRLGVRFTRRPRQPGRHAVSGTSSACSVRSANGRCDRAGAADRCGSNRRRGYWWRRWGCWWGIMDMGKADREQRVTEFSAFMALVTRSSHASER